MITRQCEYCGNEFQTHAAWIKRGESRFCSRSCAIRCRIDSGVGPKLKTRIDLSGIKFARLQVLERAANDKKNHACWLCRCDCGKKLVVNGYSLRKGTSQSCGCYHKDAVTRHGHARDFNSTTEYRSWVHAKTRCFNNKHKHWKDYGGRGITMCEEWKNDFVKFFNYIGPAPSKKHTIDRFPNNDGNYEPGNVRWATMTEQRRNQRPRKKIRG
jgi:hypothetical protein